MTTVHELTRPEARRIAVRAQLLSEPRPTDVTEVVRHLAFLQDDPTSAVARNAELVLWSRLGSSMDPHAVDEAVADGTLVDLQGLLRPAGDLVLYRAEMAAWPGTEPGWKQDNAGWLEDNDECRRDILDRLGDEGPLPSSALPDTTVVPWRSSGWNDDRNVRMMLELMAARGEVAAVGRAGRDRLWELGERVYPDDPPVPLEEATEIRAARRLRALGIARRRTTAIPVERNDVGAVGEAAVVEGVRGRWQVDPVYLDGDFSGRAALLSPLDRLVYDRKRMVELFEFDYQLEMYKPAAKRRWGYWALPVLYGDRLVGKVDATTDRDAGVLRVDAVHEDEEWSKAVRAAVDDEIEDLAAWLGLGLMR